MVTYQKWAETMKSILVILIIVTGSVVLAQDSLNVTRVGYLDTQGSALDVAVSGNYAYVADFNAGLAVIDISNPSAPSQTGYLNSGVGGTKLSSRDSMRTLRIEIMDYE